VEEEFAIQSLNRDGNDILAGNKVKGRICVIEQGLSFQSFEAYNFETPRAGDAKLRSQEVDRRRLGRDVKFLCAIVSSMASKMRKRHTLNGLSAS